MQNREIDQLAKHLLDGKISQGEFLTQCLAAASMDLGHTTLDTDRERRCGFPEVIYGEGKTTEQIKAIIDSLMQCNSPILATRVASEQAAEITAWNPSIHYNSAARTLRMGKMPTPTQGKVAVLSAGTTDLPVTEEVRETLAWMNVPTDCIDDVGVAGPQRLLSNLSRLRDISAAVVVAGMEGALPSVVGGHVDCPVIAVPTSVGYGASFQGLAALLGMLNSCASNVTVVNIDAGFKAAYVAGLISRQSHAW